MKILNGKKYFEKNDIHLGYIKSSTFIDDPRTIEKPPASSSEYPLDFLYACADTDRDIIKHGASKLQNTIAWEFTSETAIKANVIENCFISLKAPASNIVNVYDYNNTPLSSKTNEITMKYENWLSDVGSYILYSFLVKI